jgi:(p)ppGpp synthase/HD superfamily hydrolase
VPESTGAPPLTERFAAAFTVAWEVHGHQLRKKTRIPYIAHVMAVCSLALEHGADEDVAIAALLHDAIEDSVDGAATQRRIDQDFGPRVAGIVTACSDTIAVPGEPKPPWKERKERYLHHLAHDADEDALLVSACDKVHNAGSILADLRTDGDQVWQRFTVPDPHEQLWYYSSVTTILQRRLPGPLTEELARLVEKIGAHIG